LEYFHGFLNKIIEQNCFNSWLPGFLIIIITQKKQDKFLILLSKTRVKIQQQAKVTMPVSLNGYVLGPPYPLFHYSIIPDESPYLFHHPTIPLFQYSIMMFFI